jgi:hypothetical protein
VTAESKLIDDDQEGQDENHDHQAHGGTSIQMAALDPGLIRGGIVAEILDLLLWNCAESRSGD